MTRRQTEVALQRAHAVLATLLKRVPDQTVEIGDEEIANVSPTEDVRMFYDESRRVLILKVLDFRAEGGEARGEEEGR